MHVKFILIIYVYLVASNQVLIITVKMQKCNKKKILCVCLVKVV